MFAQFGDFYNIQNLINQIHGFLLRKRVDYPYIKIVYQNTFILHYNNAKEI